MKSNPHPVVERKSCDRSQVNSRLQVSATGQQASLYAKNALQTQIIRDDKVANKWETNQKINI